MDLLYLYLSCILPNDIFWKCSYFLKEFLANQLIVSSENENEVIKGLIESLLIMLSLPLVRSPNSCIGLSATVCAKLQRIVLIVSIL